MMNDMDTCTYSMDTEPQRNPWLYFARPSALGLQWDWFPFIYHNSTIFHSNWNILQSICKVPYNWPSFILMKNKLMGTSSRKVVVSLLFPFAAIFLQHFAHPQRIQTAVRLVSFSTVSLQQCNIHYIVAKLRFSLPSLSASCVLCLSTCIGGGLTREGK